MNKDFFYKQIDVGEKFHSHMDEMELAKRICSIFANMKIDVFDLSMRKHKKKILSVEVGRGHDVIRPSIYKYFHDLGYEVDFLLYGRKPEDRWNFFYRIKDYHPRELIGNEAFLLAVLALPAMQEYDYIFLNSSFVYNSNRFDSNWDYRQLMKLLKLPDRCKNGFLTIPPHPAFYKNTDTNVEYFTHLGTNNTPMMSVSYFGDVDITPKSDKNIFLVTGNIDKNQKNHGMIFKAIQQLLVDGVENFEVWINGMIVDKLVIPDSLKKHVKYLGENKPETLFPILEKADFIIAGLDSEQEWQKNNYAKGTCSVGLIYSLGFGKIYICEELFANAFALNSQNALIYPKGGLVAAMKKAIHLSVTDYTNMQRQIVQEGLNRQKRSLEDIARILEKLKRVYRRRIYSTHMLSSKNLLKYIRLKICYSIFKNKRDHYEEKMNALFHNL